MNRVIVAVLGVCAVLGMKFYNRSASASDVKAQLVSVCAGDAGCVRTVETHFDSCFESAYKMGGRRRASRLDAEQLAQCLNSKGKQPYFTTAE